MKKQFHIAGKMDLKLCKILTTQQKKTLRDVPENVTGRIIKNLEVQFMCVCVCITSPFCMPLGCMREHRLRTGN